MGSRGFLWVWIMGVTSVDTYPILHLFTTLSRSAGKCSKQALLKVTLGRRERFLKVHLESLRSSKQWSFHVSDSPHARGSVRYVDASPADETITPPPRTSSELFNGSIAENSTVMAEEVLLPYSEAFLYNGLLTVLGDNELNIDYDGGQRAHQLQAQVSNDDKMTFTSSTKKTKHDVSDEIFFLVLSCLIVWMIVWFSIPYFF